MKDTVRGDEPAAKARTQRGRKRQGRTIIGALLISFVLVASTVIWRRSYGVQLSRELADLDRRLKQLDGQRATLRRSIHDESSRSLLAPVAERLGMKVPNDRQVRILPR